MSPADVAALAAEYPEGIPPWMLAPHDAYEAALAALREDTQSWWADTLACDPDELGEGEEPATADVEGLRRSKARCCHGSRTGGRNWPTGR